MYSSSLIMFHSKPWRGGGLRNRPTDTHHADFKGIEQVKGQCGHQVNDEPCGQVVNADLSSVKDHLARLADVSGTKIKNNIWQGNRMKKDGELVWLLQILIPR